MSLVQRVPFVVLLWREARERLSELLARGSDPLDAAITRFAGEIYTNNPPNYRARGSLFSLAFAQSSGVLLSLSTTTRQRREIVERERERESSKLQHLCGAFEANLSSPCGLFFFFFFGFLLHLFFTRRFHLFLSPTLHNNKPRQR